ncbi:hypothetical protein H0H93_010490 [Arthromyces matolae]|nr:hypothetical protein H0H93_010490 [Arthromyces matolae]
MPSIVSSGSSHQPISTELELFFRSNSQLLSTARSAQALLSPKSGMNRTPASVKTRSLPNKLQRLLDNAEKECADQLSRDKQPVIDVTRDEHLPINLMKLIYELKDDSYAQWFSHPKLLQLYFHQFDFDLPTIPDLDSAPIQPTMAFHGFRRAFPEVGEFDEEYKQMCVTNWPKMFKWLEFLYRGIITRFSPHPSIAGLDEAIESILFLVTDRDIDPRIISTTGLLGLSFAIHLHLSGKDDLERLQLSTGILMSLLYYCPVSNLNEIRKEIGYDSRKAARVFFNPAYSCIRGKWT